MKPPTMSWPVGECLALANQHCTFCYGLGRRFGRCGIQTRCHCVLRAVFRACLRRFTQLAQKQPGLTRCATYAADGPRGSRGGGKKVYGFRDQEYCADFCNIAKRTLGQESLSYKVFKFHFLLGADWKLCSRRLAMNKGSFFHEVYRVEERLGAAFRETKPYGLYPLDEYFCDATRGPGIGNILDRVAATCDQTSSSAAETLSPSRAEDATGRLGGPLRPPLSGLCA